LIDLHAHYLPGIDDGPKTLEDSLEMARLAVADGISAVTVTPHHLNGRYVTEASTIREELGKLCRALEEHGIPLLLYPGSEIHLTPELPAALADGSAMTVADRGRAVLVEPPVNSLPLGAEAILSECLVQGITPIIAHPERCRPLQADHSPLRRWVEMGCLVQVTAQSCTGHFGRRPREAARAMISEGLVHLLASDGHRPYGRIPCLSAGRAEVAAWAGETLATHLTETVPEALLAGEVPDIQSLKASLPEGSLTQGKPGRVRSIFKRWLGVTD
jgi:protein-tyrosine phosphatase